MTIDEAIKHEEELAEEKENNAKNYPRPNKSVKGSGRKYNAYLKCAQEYRQLAEWLKDYKRLLEQEPCEDAISRQDLREPRFIIAENDYQKGWNDALDSVYENAPSVTPAEKVGRWISVSERLPEYAISDRVSEDVLVFDGTDIRVGEYRKGIHLNGAGYWRVFGYEIDEHVDVIAWMPLPEPYKASPTGAEGSDKE